MSRMPNKEVPASRPVEVKQPAVVAQHASVVKPPNVTTKVVPTKIVKDAAMSPTAASSDTERTELLGSLTTLQQQRTSARVIKKLKLEPPAEKRCKRDGQTDDLTECDTPNKLEQELKFPTVKQRMPKALWSTDEKNLFFEALNEYGKDFDAITAYICAKAKKKGVPDVNLKTKTQVSHFYYRTWHKLSKHVHFDENVKKVAQELYALINYGELRKKLVSVSEKTCARLSEMVQCGSLVVRVRGRNVRVRTPMCRALRRLNQIHERACGVRVCTRALISLCARSASAWRRVQAAAHNPRLQLLAPLRLRLAHVLAALQRRWKVNSWRQYPEDQHEEDNYLQEPKYDDDDEDHLGLETDRIITQEHRLPRKLALHVGPRPDVTINLPVLTPSEQLSSQKICFSSYLQRMCSLRHKDTSAKMRAPKRQRKDSATDKDKEMEQKKLRLEEDPTKLMQIDETAVDGIDLMATYRNIQDEEEKPSTEDEKELKSEETAEEDLERDGYKEMSEREKDSFSEMEDDEKYNKSDTDNESDHGKKRDKEFKNLKVKFRIRPKIRGGTEYTLVSVVDKDDEVKIDDTAKDDDVKADDVKTDDSKPDEAKVDETKADEVKGEEKIEEPKLDVDIETAMKQIRRGWSIHDAGDLTIGDLYLMFGARSRLELDYWWAEPTPPLPAPPHKAKTESPPERKTDKTPDKGTDSSVEDGDKRESDTDIFSPKPFGQDSNDGLSGDERKSEQLASPEHKSSSNASLKLVCKLINRPLPLAPPASNTGLALVGDRLKRLLALAGNPHVPVCGGIARCECGHVCSAQRKQQQRHQGVGPPLSKPDDPSVVFRHPTPIAPRPDAEPAPPTSALGGLPRWRRGRPRGSSRRVVVQRLLPLMPKLAPSSSNLIPVKIVPNSPPVPPKILPKPPPTTTSDPLYYVVQNSNGQYYFQDGDRRVPISQLPDEYNEEESFETKDEMDLLDIQPETITGSTSLKEDNKEKVTEDTPTTRVIETNNTNASEIAQFLPSESMSLSPSRLLRDADCWPEGSVQDFSLSSFLGHLEARQPELQVDSQLQSLMAESSVDYVAKFADLAAEVADVAPTDNLPSDDLT
ncbi:protein cramped isoform X2 [Plodia interpunctella]|uniref:protein cramped isoform X2 n=1 Tax=Plodia interpunctella TaxID=58824 RepID=UPI002367A1DD|nr:protein cramped isoform X2 [Plodia interpunctella]